MIKYPLNRYFSLKQLIFFILFLSLLLGLRLLWLNANAIPDQPLATQGILDLRNWDFERNRTIYLNGEWEFYPNQFISHQDTQGNQMIAPSHIQVPGDWRSGFSEIKDSPYGYGTYRLRILVGKEQTQPYGFWIQKVEAASQVEINGLPEPSFGVLAKQEADYDPKAVSYTATYIAGDHKVIELLVRAANFDNPVRGGITSSIRFGLQGAIDNQRMYSLGFQLIAFFILLLHGLYAGMLFFFNPKQKLFIVFLLMLFTVSIAIVADNDSILLLWLPINYTWGFKIRLLSYLWISYSMIELTRSFFAVGKPVLPFQVYRIALYIYSFVVLVAPIDFVLYTASVGNIFILLYLPPILGVVYLIGKMIFKNQQDAVYLFAAATGILSNVMWGIYVYSNPADNTYYPVDIIASIIGFSAYWFKQYFRKSKENARLNEQLQQSDKLKDEFLENTSHELRTPLHGIINIAQTIVANEKQSLNEKSFKDLELLVTIGRRMSFLVNNLLDTVKLQDQKIRLQQEPVRIQSAASGVIDMLAFLTSGKPIKLQMNINETFPLVYADEKRLVQILFNLLHNAIKFTDAGKIVITAEARGDQAVIHVSDTGSGINADTRERVFNRYEQGDIRTNNGGLGLGLSICKQLVELHEGELTVASAPGKGSVFSFTLPLAHAAQTEGSAEAAAASDSEKVAMENIPSLDVHQDIATLSDMWTALQDSNSTAYSGKLNILAVDDDPVNLKVLLSILSSDQYHIQTAMSGAEAVSLLVSRRWDLLICDVMMPHMSGYELTRIVRERFKISELPILLLTARSQPEDIYAGFLSGANDYVVKPVDALELRYRVWSLTALRQSVNDSLRMEAAYLQAQIQPHFLFNTLNSIMALSTIDPEKMRKLGEAFTSYLRISFNFMNAERLVPLSHELELVRAYLYIEEERFGERLHIEWDIGRNITLMLPPLTIQPLVENAVRHGLLRRSAGGTLIIRITDRGGDTLFEVIDNGTGIEQPLVKQLLDNSHRGKGGIGLSNTNRRLVQLYGQGLIIHSKPGEGTTVSFTIPKPASSLTGTGKTPFA
ncbi:ATP-binding protein [Paenibacillus sp. GCM10012307]|uniref:Circadian input-output histidine kinase CikA n=1 Tax=Paenibacillus roseus TaxID=2798579 RepID=A0A934J235_9BACL|nr:ATP-binding protein [Paenibacillus roseus]MBJ6360139.1 response regulator [Paenibacillus roseus]